jgi:hypothetical protein
MSWIHNYRFITEEEFKILEHKIQSGSCAWTSPYMDFLFGGRLSDFKYKNIPSELDFYKNEDDLIIFNEENTETYYISFDMVINAQKIRKRKLDNLNENDL